MNTIQNLQRTSLKCLNAKKQAAQVNESARFYLFIFLSATITDMLLQF
jgi:hypothetical protein